MHTLAGECIKCGWQCSHECFTFTRTHLSDLAAMQDHTTNKLHIIMTHTQSTLRRLTHQCEHFSKYIIERLTTLYTLFTRSKAFNEVVV